MFEGLVLWIPEGVTTGGQPAGFKPGETPGGVTGSNLFSPCDSMHIESVKSCLLFISEGIRPWPPDKPAANKL